MNRQEMIARIRENGFDREGYWLVAGGAMLLYGIRRETRDIDLGCSSERARELLDRGLPESRMRDGTRRIEAAEDIEIFENWLCGGVTTFDGIPVITLEGLVEMKKRLGRPKDMADLELIWQYARERGIRL